MPQSVLDSLAPRESRSSALDTLAPRAPSLATRARDVAIGAGKGLVQEVSGLADLFTPAINKMATMTFGSRAALPPDAESASESLGLGASNRDQQIGKYIEFAGSVLSPFAIKKAKALLAAGRSDEALQVLKGAEQFRPAGYRPTTTDATKLPYVVGDAPTKLPRSTKLGASAGPPRLTGRKAPLVPSVEQTVQDALEELGPRTAPASGRAVTATKMAAPRLASEEEGARKLEELTDALHGVDAPTKGNGTFGRIADAAESVATTAGPAAAATAIEQKVRLTVGELAQKMRTRYGSARAGKMLQPNQPAKVGAAQIKRLAPGPSQMPEIVKESIQETGGLMKKGTPAQQAGYATTLGKYSSEGGGINPMLLASGGGAAVGAAAGATQGDTAGERVQNAVLGGAAGAVAAPFVAHAVAVGAPKALQNFLYTSVLSSPQSVIKAYSGAVGGAVAAALEKLSVGNARDGMAILNELFSARSAQTFVRALRSPETASLSGMGREAPTLVGRVFGAGDAVARRAMSMGGVSMEDAARYTLSGIPTTPMGQDVLGLWSRYFPLRLATTLFPRVGIQVVERGLERTPAGLAKLGGLNEGVSAGTRLARAAGGTAAGTAAYAANDQLPDWTKPYLVALSGVYGLPVGLGIAGAEAAKRGKGAVGQLKAGVAEFASNLPFPQFGPAQALDPENLASLAVPNLVRDVARARDPHERQTAGETLGRARAKIPGLRETLPVKGRNVNIAGEPNEDRSSAVQRFFTPATKEPLPMKGIPDRVAKELERLDISINNPSFERTLTIGKREIAIPADLAERNRAERRRYLLPQIEKILSSPAYARADDTRRATMLKAVIQRAETAGAQRARASLINSLRSQGALRGSPR